MDKNSIATVVGVIGGGVFFVLNIATKGEVPGGFQGGVLGFILGYALARLVLAFFPTTEPAELPAKAGPVLPPKDQLTCEGCEKTFPSHYWLEVVNDRSLCADCQERVAST